MNPDREKNWLAHDHRKYDAVLEDCFSAADICDWKTAISLFNGFVEELKLHMRMEDEVLYPLLREESGDPGGELALLGDEQHLDAGLDRLCVLGVSDFEASIFPFEDGAYERTLDYLESRLQP